MDIKWRFSCVTEVFGDRKDILNSVIKDVFGVREDFAIFRCYQLSGFDITLIVTTFEHLDDLSSFHREIIVCYIDL